MPTGLAVPVRVTPLGGTELVSGEANDQKILFLALGEDDNEHAFQQGLGMGSGMVFDPDSPRTRAEVQRRLVSIFARFERDKRYRLVRGSVAWGSDETKQETWLEFRYMNIESDEERSFRRTFQRGGDA